MQENEGKLLFEVRADQSDIKKDIEAIKKQFESLTEKTKEEGKKQAEVWQNLIKGATAYFTLQGASAFIKQVVAVRSQFQQLEISFGTMLKSKEKANELMAQMADLAAKTPFGLEEVSEGAKRLLAFQVPAEEVTETLRRMGDVASGLGVPMGQLIHVYGQVKAQGKLMTNDLYQFMNAGIPIIAELSKVVGKSETEIKDMVSAGKIGFPEVQAVIKNMTNEGGLFFNLMAEQSKSLGGQISNLGDSFDQMLNDIGKASEGYISGAIQGVTFLVENYKTLGKVIAGLIVTYGAYRTAVLVNIALTKGWAVAAKEDAIAKGIQTAATKAQTIATAALNTVMKANPYVLVATAVVGLGAAIWALRDATNADAEATELHNKLRAEQASKIDNEKNRIGGLISVIQDETKSWNERNKAFLELQKTTGGVLDKYSSLNQVLREMSQVLKDLNGRYETMNENMSREAVTKTEKGIKAKEAEIRRLEELQKKVDNTASIGIQQSIDRLKKQIDTDRLLAGKQKKIVFKIDVDNYANSLANKSLAELKAEQNLINEAYNIDKERRKNFAKVAIGEFESNNPFLKYNYEERGAYNEAIKTQIKLRQQENEKTTDTRKLYTDILSLQKEINKQKNANKNSIVSESNERELSEKEAKLKGFVDKYKSLTGIDLTEKSSSKKSTNAKSNLLNFDQEAHLQQTQRLNINNELAERKRGIDQLQDGYNKELELIHYYYDEKAEAIRRGGEDARKALDKENTDSKGLMSSDAYNARLKAINENEIIANEQNNNLKKQQEQKLLEELLKEYESYEDKKEAILKKYQEQVEVIHQTIKDSHKQKQILSKLEREKKKELDKLKIESQENTDIFKKLFSDFSLYSRSELENVLNESKKALDTLKDSLDLSNPDNVTYLKNLVDQIERLEGNLNGKSNVFERLIKNFGIISNDGSDEYSKNKARNGITLDFGELSNQLGGVSHMFEKLGNDIESSLLKSFAKITDGIQKAAQGLSQAFDTSQSKGSRIANGISAGVGFVVDMIGSISANKKSRKRAEAQDKKNLLDFQRDYNIALNEELRLRTELSSSGLTSQYVNRIKDGLSSLHEATRKQQEEIQNLINSGKVKKGTRNVVDWGAVGSDTLKGAGAGAAIGSIFSPIGTAIGAAVGAVVGFVGGLFKKKRKQKWSGILTEFPELIERADNGLLKVNNSLLQSLKANHQLSNETLEIVNNIDKWNEQIDKSKKQIEQVVDEIVSGLGDNIRKNLVDSFKAGEDAIESLRKTFSTLVEDMTSKILMDVLFEPAFKQFKDNAKYSYDFGGDQTLVDDIGVLYQTIIAQRQKFNEGLKAANEEGKKLGLDIFNSDATRQATEKGFARISQDSAEELNGRFTLMTALEKQTVDSIKEMHQSLVSLSERQLRHLANIDTNTYQLHQVKDDISGMKKDMAGVKTILGNIETKGIKMRT